MLNSLAYRRAYIVKQSSRRNSLNAHVNAVHPSLKNQYSTTSDMASLISGIALKTRKVALDEGDARSGFSPRIPSIPQVSGPSSILSSAKVTYHSNTGLAEIRRERSRCETRSPGYSGDDIVLRFYFLAVFERADSWMVMGLEARLCEDWSSR